MGSDECLGHSWSRKVNTAVYSHVLLRLLRRGRWASYARFKTRSRTFYQAPKTSNLSALCLQLWYTKWIWTEFCVIWSQEMATDAFLYAFIFSMGSRAPAASGNFLLICRPNGGTPIQCCKASPCLWRTEDPNKQQAVLVFDSEHNSAAWGFGVSVRLEKSLGHALGVLDVVWHQSLLFGVWEWEAEVIDIRQASVLSLRGIGTWWREPAF